MSLDWGWLQPLQVELCENLSLVQALREVGEESSCSEQHILQMYQVDKLNIKV